VEIAYWIVAGLLAAFYLFSGGIKIVRSKEQLEPMMAWLDTVPMPIVRTIGALEALAAIGLVLPPLTGIAAPLAIAAAAGLLVLQLLATGLHLSRGEVSVTGLNVVLVVLAGLAVWLGTSVV